MLREPDRSNTHVLLTAHSVFHQITSVAALIVHSMRKKQLKVVTTTVRHEGTYKIPHSPILAPLALISYSIVALATLISLYLYLRGAKHLLPPLQKVSIARPRPRKCLTASQLSLLMPMPVLLWAWLNACTSAFAWHLTPPMTSCAVSRRLRLKPIVLNVIATVVPLLVFALQLALVIEWPILQQRYSDNLAVLTKLMGSLSPEDRLLVAAQADTDVAFMRAQGMYQTVWGIWAAAYGLCWLVSEIHLRAIEIH